MSSACACPCCGFRTLPDSGAYDLCPVCWWEDDGLHDDDVASVGGPNGKTLAEGQRLYEGYGASDLSGLRRVRAPEPDEARDPGWTPGPRSTGEAQTPYFLRDLGCLVQILTEEAREVARSSRKGGDIGRFCGLRDALVLLVEQADSFGIPREDVGVDPQLDLERDLLLDPPRGFIAG